MERCLIDGNEVEIPEILAQNMHVFLEVVSVNTWQNVLTAEHKERLKKFLPDFGELNDIEEKDKTVRMLLNGENFKFGNPLVQFHRKLRKGKFHPDVARYAELVRSAKIKDYMFSQQIYYSKLLQQIVINRQRVLESLYRTRPDHPVKTDHIYWTESRHHSNLDIRVNHECHRIIREINDECGQNDTSSDDDDDNCSSRDQLRASAARALSRHVSVPRAQEPRVKGAPSSSVVATYAPRSSGDPGSTLSLQSKNHSAHVRSYSEVSNQDYKNLLRSYKRRKLEDSLHPEMVIDDITLDGIIDRVQMSRRIKIPASVVAAASVIKRKKPATIKTSESSTDLSSGLKMMKPGSHARPNASVPVNKTLSGPAVRKEVTKREETEESGGVESEEDNDIDVMDCSPRPSSSKIGKVYPDFFSLLKDLICEEPDGKISTMKIEEKVRMWMLAEPSMISNRWTSELPNWTHAVLSALKFLAGNSLRITDDSFTALLDYKERSQQWKWLSHAESADLTKLYQLWLDNRDKETGSDVTGHVTNIPPARVATDYTVTASSAEEKEIFRNQERERFANPHRAYTYRMHGYESVVGPVKGVYSKENAAFKARDHSLLVKERPAYVTILTLVRDSAARLPNGEGTRSDICELLKDSGFLAPDVSDGQLNTVVSGALDRLHYEKDPCVKYDNIRKVWIYRHRCRSVDEFEKLHEAQAAAIKAKKVSTKSKPIRTDKGDEITPAELDATIPQPMVDHSGSAFTAESDMVKRVGRGTPRQSPQTFVRFVSSPSTHQPHDSSAQSELDAAIASIDQTRQGVGGVIDLPVAPQAHVSHQRRSLPGQARVAVPGSARIAGPARAVIPGQARAAVLGQARVSGQALAVGPGQARVAGPGQVRSAVPGQAQAPGETLLRTSLVSDDGSPGSLNYMILSKLKGSPVMVTAGKKVSSASKTVTNTSPHVILVSSGQHLSSTPPALRRSLTIENQTSKIASLTPNHLAQINSTSPSVGQGQGQNMGQGHTVGQVLGQGRGQGLSSALTAVASLERAQLVQQRAAESAERVKMVPANKEGAGQHSVLNTSKVGTGSPTVLRPGLISQLNRSVSSGVPQGASLVTLTSQGQVLIGSQALGFRSPTGQIKVGRGASQQTVRLVSVPAGIINQTCKSDGSNVRPAFLLATALNQSPASINQSMITTAATHDKIGRVTAQPRTVVQHLTALSSGLNPTQSTQLSVSSGLRPAQLISAEQRQEQLKVSPAGFSAVRMPRLITGPRQTLGSPDSIVQVGLRPVRIGTAASPRFVVRHKVDSQPPEQIE